MEEEMTAGSSRLALDVLVRRTQLDVIIDNHGTDSVRVWDRSNSWGWNTLSLTVATLSPSESHFTLTPKVRAFTRNGPGFIEIPAGGSHLTVITPDYPEWDQLERIAHLRGETLRVQANLRIPPSPEATVLGVFVGEVDSQWQESQPPHLWLFTEP